DGRIRYDGPVSGLRTLDDAFIQSFFRILDMQAPVEGRSDATS
ncbi:MAG: hypothetical protein RL199_2487, partial [Pseudomonadota bacterium]